MFNYTDHLGNIRLSYSQDPSNNVLKIIEENHYYPFGLKHSGYNAEQLMYSRSGGVSKIVPVPPLFLTSYNIKFQNQKREEELGLNWDSFKWRNYDYAIGRFHSIDPLSDKYTYNSTYAFQENKMGIGRELEGLEVEIFFENTSLSPTVGALTKISEVSIEESIGETSSTMEVHHIIPKALKGNEVVEAAREEGFKFEGQENKIPLEKFSKTTGEGRHGNHPKYNEAIMNMIKQGPTKEMSALEFIRSLVSNVKGQIQNNPTTKINNLLKTTTTVIESTGTKKPEIPPPGRSIVPKPKPKPYDPMYM